MDIPSKDNSTYSYDHVVDEKETQADIFERVGKPVADSFLEGIHGCLIAYGQTGAGKTFTMQGPDADAVPPEDAMDDTPSADAGAGDATAGDAPDAESAGLIPRVLQHVFQRIESERAQNSEEGASVEFTVKCSYLEIYNETVADLLVEAGGVQGAQPNIREDAKRGMFVENLTEEVVTSAGATYDIFHRGSLNRRVGMTEMNRESSRSHSVFTVSLESRRHAHAGGAVQKRSALLHLVDLAGSERQKSTESAGVRLKVRRCKLTSALDPAFKALAFN